MFGNFGFENEINVQSRACGRRHIQRDSSQVVTPTYMTAPFAVQQEPKRRLATLPENVQQRETDVLSVAVAAHPPPARLKEERVLRGGLDIFSWNTEPPVPLLPRAVRERDEAELRQLRPIDPEAQRDFEVRAKFTENPHSRFLCFSDEENVKKHRGRRFGCPPLEELVDNQELGGSPKNGKTPILYGRRGRNSREKCDNTCGIAGFAGMGMGNVRR